MSPSGDIKAIKTYIEKCWPVIATEVNMALYRDNIGHMGWGEMAFVSLDQF